MPGEISEEEMAAIVQRMVEAANSAGTAAEAAHPPPTKDNEP